MGQSYIDVVAIDAGHGGKDPGAFGGKYKEKDLTLSIALKLGNYIEENMKDVKVIYTRKTDEFIPLHKRTEIANKNDADLFISIHCNATASSQPYGTETFVMGPHKNDDNLEVAKQENASVLLEDNYEAQYQGFDPNSPEAHIIFSLYQNTYLNQSLKIADRVQTQFRERVGRHDRGVKQAGFLVLWQAAMPSILVEAGFLSNPAEQDFLGSEKGQVYIASAIYRAFRDYKIEMEGDSEKRNDTAKKTEEDIIAEKEDKQEHNKKEYAEEDAEENVEEDAEEDAEENVEEDAEEDVEEDVEENVEENAELFFAVQFAASNSKKDVSSFDKVNNVKRYYQNGMYKYYTGHERSLNTAVSLQYKIQKLGYDDAFVIAFYKDKRISVHEASKKVAEK